MMDSTAAHNNTSLESCRHDTVVDMHGLVVSVSSGLDASQKQKVVHSINEYMRQVFRYGRNWNVIEDAVHADSQCVLAHVLAADYEVARERMPKVHEHLKKASQIIESGALQVTEREKWYVEAWQKWLGGNSVEAYDIFRKILKAYPRDLFALKRGQLVAFLIGDHAGMLQIAKEVEHECQGLEYYNGMLAFAYEQNEMGDKAEEAALKAISVFEDDPWAHHALAHALYYMGRLDEGINMMKKYSHFWNGCMSFMYTHNWFHYALFYLDVPDFSQVARIYDEHIFLPEDRQITVNKQKTQDNAFPLRDNTNSQDQLGAMGFLWKWELRGGHDLDGRWQHLLNYVKDRTEEHYDPFFDLLLLHTLSRTGHHDKAKQMLSSMERYVTTVASPRKEDLNDVWLPFANGIVLADEGNHKDAVAFLSRPLESGKLKIVGGSNEQREVLREFYVDTLMKAQQHEQARRMLTGMLEERSCVEAYRQMLHKIQPA